MGARALRIDSIRPGAIPPDPWDDIPRDKLAWQPLRVIDILLNCSWTDEKIIARVSKKFKLSPIQIIQYIGRCRRHAIW